MTPEQKAIIRLRFRIASFAYLAAIGLMAFVLAWSGKDVAAFGVVAGTIAAPLTVLLGADYATTPK